MKRRWDDNIKMDLEEIGWNRFDWIHVAEDRDKRRALANTFMDFLVPAGSFSTSWGGIGFSKWSSLNEMRITICTHFEVRTCILKGQIKTPTSYRAEIGVLINVRVTDFAKEN